MTTGTRSRPSSCMRPWATASRSAAPIVTEAHVVPLPASSRCSEDASPPAAGTGSSAPPLVVRKLSGPRFETTRVPLTPGDPLSGRALSSRAPISRAPWQRRVGGAFERGAQHVDGLRPQLVQGPVAMDALAEVHLGQAVGAERLGDVDQQAELDAVAAGESELLEDPA